MSLNISNVDIEPGMPNAPTVRIRDVGGPMPAGTYWFAVMGYYTEPKSGAQSYTQSSENGVTTMSNSGIDAMGPARKVFVDHPWTIVEVGDLNVDESRPYLRVMMSMDGKTFWNIATAPAVNATSSYYSRDDQTFVRGVRQKNGLYRVIIHNPAARYQTTTGNSVSRATAPQHAHTVSMQPFFAMNRRETMPPFQPYTTTPSTVSPPPRPPPPPSPQLKQQSATSCNACTGNDHVKQHQKLKQMRSYGVSMVGVGLLAGGVALYLIKKHMDKADK